MNFQLLSKKTSYRWTIGLILAAIGITGGTVFYGVSQSLQTSKQSETTEIPTIQQVTALGRLEPEGEVLRVSTPTTLSNDRIAQLLVKRGDRVEANQTIAILDSRDRLQSALLEAQKQVTVAQAGLAKVKAGAKSGEIIAQQAQIARLQAELLTQVEAQKATIARLDAQQRTEIAAQKATIARSQAEVNNAQVEYQRYENLFQEGATSASTRDSKRLTLQTAQQQLAEAQANLKRIQTTSQQQLLEAQANLKRFQTTGEAQVKEAKATLNRIAEVRPVDVEEAQAQVEQAKAAAKQAQDNLEQAYIRAPMAGRILEIYAKPGEAVSSSGIVNLGQTDQMQVVAEVYQTDIGKINQGQQATITSESFPGEVHGTVRLVGLEVTQQEVTSNEPGENLDRRIVKVRIRLNPEDSKRVQDLTNLQVQVAIKI
jgi:HlyD family secretion protein